LNNERKIRHARKHSHIAERAIDGNKNSRVTQHNGSVLGGNKFCKLFYLKKL